MASIYKPLLDTDVTSTKTLLHEAIPITGSIVSGTYSEASSLSSNIKNYTHGMFQSVYDYPYLSSSANHIFDLSVGFHASSSLYAATTISAAQKAKKNNLYNQYAQVLMGHDENGNIRQFDQDGDLTSGNKLRECVFLDFSRLLVKDEIKKGSFEIKFGADHDFDTPYVSLGPILTITDAGAATSFKVNSPTGEYGILSASQAGAYSASFANGQVGLLFYQAGIAVLTASLFMGSATTAHGGALQQDAQMDSAYNSFADILTASSIQSCCDAFRHRLYKISVKNTKFDAPISYVTSIGLYSPDQELVAVAKLSEPIKKTPDTEATFRVRLDY